MNAWWGKWEDRFNARLDCPARTPPPTSPPTPATTPKPDGFYSWTWTGSAPITLFDGSLSDPNGFPIAVGETVKISEVCNPDFKDGFGDGCSMYPDMGWCLDGIWTYTQEDFLYYGRYDPTEQTFQTGLNCPQCGCTDTYIKPLTDFKVEAVSARSGKKDKKELV